MKTILLLPIFILFYNFSFSQKPDTVKAVTPTIYNPIGDGYIPYIVGSATIPGYEIRVMSCKNDSSVTLKNGTKIAGLSCILSENKEYIGGKLIFEGDTTEIRKIIVTPVGNDGAKFTVRGKDFDMSFTLDNGIILAYQSDCAVFSTENVGIWTIVKKEA